MTCAALRPYFAPYPGFFRIAAEVETLVLLDRVQFPRGTTWLTRNRFKNADGELWLTVPVWKKGLGLQCIGDVRICREGAWPRKHLQSLRAAYARAPYVQDHLPFLERLYGSGQEHLARFNTAIIRHIAQALGLGVRIVPQSDIGIEGLGSALLARLCRHLGADELVVPGGAEDHMERAPLELEGVRIRPLRSRPPVYPQLWGPFVPNLSTFDMLFTCGPASRRLLRKDADGTPEGGEIRDPGPGSRQ